MKISVQDLLASQAWYLHAIDGGSADYIEMNEAAFAASPFLDQRIAAPKGGRKFKARIAALTAAPAWASASIASPRRYILHISHVGSTLLSRIAGISPTCLSLREPVPLRHLARHFEDQGTLQAWHSPEAFKALVDFTLRNLGRPLGERSRVVVKCTSWVNPLGDHFLKPENGDGARVAAAFMALPNFVANTLKGAGGVTDLRSNAQSRLRRLQKLVPEVDTPLYTMKPGQIAAMTWLCELMTIRAVCERAAASVQWIDFDVFMQAPEEGARTLANQLDLEWDDRSDGLLIESGVLGAYSKAGKSVKFSNDQRISLLEKFKSDNAGLLNDATAWLDHVVQRTPAIGSWLGNLSVRGGEGRTTRAPALS